MCRLWRRTQAEAIPAGAILAEFMRFPAVDFSWVPANEPRRKTPERYVVLLLPAGAADHVSLLDLGEAAVIDAAITRFRSALTARGLQNRALFEHDPDEAMPDEGFDLRTMVFDPLTACSPETTRWIFAAESNLCWLPFDALPLPNGERVFDKHTISYVSSGRELLRPQFSGPVGQPVVLADPDFGLISGSTEASPDADRRKASETRALSRSGDSLGPH